MKTGRKIKHGHHTLDKARSKEYVAWDHMKSRCVNPKSANYRHYGGRGIRVCDRWLKFENFISDMGFAPSKNHSIDRVDNNGNYEPENCRWATNIQQQNNRTDNRIIVAFGQSKTMSEWCRELGIPKTTVMYRIQAGATGEDCFIRKRKPRTTPNHLVL